MKLFRSAPLLLLTLAACGALDNAARPDANLDPNALQEQAANAASTAELPTVDLGSMLGGVTDQASAEAAKNPLTDAVGKLQAALDGAKAKTNLESTAGATGATGAAGGTSNWSNDVLAKFGIGSGTVDQIRSLLANEQVKAVLGPTLEKLQGLLAGG